MTQDSLAHSSGVPVGTIRGWIAKKYFPKVNDGIKIARALGVSVEYLVDGVQPSGQAGVEYVAEEPAQGYAVSLEERVKARPVVHGIVRDLLAIPDDKLEAVGYMVAGLKAAEEKQGGSKMA